MNNNTEYILHLIWLNCTFLFKAVNSVYFTKNVSQILFNFLLGVYFADNYGPKNVLLQAVMGKVLIAFTITNTGIEGDL